MKRLLTTLAVAGLVAGCGGSTASDTTRTATETTSVPSASVAPPTTRAVEPASPSSTEPGGTDAALEDALASYDAAAIGRDARETYEYLSEGCKDEISRGEWAAQLDNSAFLEELGLKQSDVSTTNRVVNIDGDEAYVSYDVVGPDGRPLLGDGKSTIYALWIVETDGSWRRAYCLETGAPLEGHTTAAADEVGDVGTRGNPVPIGQTADVGDGWTLTVNSASINANDEITAANEINEPPADGKQYVLANVTAGYTGPDESSALGVNLQVLGEGTNKPIGNYDSLVIPPEPQFLGNELFKDGEDVGNVAFEIDVSDADTLVLIAQSFGSFGDSDRKFFALS